MEDYKRKFDEIQDRYTKLSLMAQKQGFKLEPLDPLSVDCSVGDSCCSGLDMPSKNEHILTEQEASIRKESTILKGQYSTMVSNMIKDGVLSDEIKGLVDSCGCGDHCSTGTTDNVNNLLDEIAIKTTQLKNLRKVGTNKEELEKLKDSYKSLADKISKASEIAMSPIDLVGYTCVGGDHCHGGSNYQLDRLSLVSAAANS